jgi:hypothetical protein
VAINARALILMGILNSLEERQKDIPMIMNVVSKAVSFIRQIFENSHPMI